MPKKAISHWKNVSSLAAVPQCYNAPSTSAGLGGHRPGATSNSDRGLSSTSRYAGRSLRNTLAGLSGTLDNALTNGSGAFDRALHRALHRSVRSLCWQR
jgi:hypothetical protein